MQTNMQENPNAHEHHRKRNRVALLLIFAGVPCTLFDVPGAYDVFDQIEARSTPARNYRRVLL